MPPGGRGWGRRRGPPLGCEAPRGRDHPRPQSWGKDPLGRGRWFLGGFVPSLGPFLGDPQEENKARTVLIRPENRNQNLQAPLAGFTNNSRNLPSLKLHPYFLGRRFPTHQTDLYLILFHALLVQGSFSSSLHPPFFLYLFFLLPPLQSLISFSPTHSDAAYFLLTLMAPVSPQYLSGTRQR